MRIVFVPAAWADLGRAGRGAIALVVLAFGCRTAFPVHAQAPSPVSIPLSLVAPAGGSPYQLGIQIGIDGGASQRYLFDTGSAIFNANYLTNVPNSPFGPNGNNITYAYGPNGDLGSVTGTLLEAKSLTFYNQAGGAVATLSADPGYMVNAVTSVTAGSANPNLRYNFDGTNYYGVFGAGNFVSWSSAGGPAGIPAPGGILGQTIVSGATQGYVMSANAWLNPGATTALASQPNGTTVMIGDQSYSIACSPCVTVGLTPEVIGQFAPVGPLSPTNQVGVVPLETGTHRFRNPYGGDQGNKASTAFGGIFTISLTKDGQTVSSTAPTLLDTGASPLLSQSLNNPAVSDGTSVQDGTTVSATGVTQGGAPVPGLPSTTAVFADPPNSHSAATYHAGFYPPDPTCTAPNTCNRSGIWFFLQNSVMYDLSDNVIGYTPFFVTNTKLATTAGANLIVNGNNVQLGLAGVIAGAGGVQVESGGAVQLSAANTYTGATTIDPGGQLNIAGPGSIAMSSGVTNNGIFDISRAWNTVSVQNLLGSGQTFLGAGKLTITNANGTYAGTVADSGGAYDVAGGKIELAGGTLFLLGANTYSGGTIVNSGATLMIQADSALGNASGGLTLDGGTLMAQANLATARNVRLDSNGGTFDTNGFALTLGAPVNGTGALSKNGLGVLTLSGANDYTGGTVVNGGTLQLAPGASLPSSGVLVVNGGTMDFNGNDVTVGGLAGLGGTVSLGGAILTVAEQGNTAFGGTITGAGGLIVQGPGLLTLSGINTYTGPTNVTGGRLSVNGSIASDVTVRPGGNLGGNGNIFGTVNVLGAIAPGNSIGTLTVNGAYTQAPGSSYLVETNNAGQTDRINVTGAPGTATLAGGAVVVTSATGVYAPSTTSTILNATGGVIGTYAGAASLYPFLQPSLSYDANNVYLTLRPGGFGAGGATANQSAVGRALDQSVAGSSGDLATVIGTMATYTLGQGQAAMTAISGQNYSGFGTANVGGGVMFMNALAQQLSVARTGRGEASRLALAEVCEPVAFEACEGERRSPWSLWGSALGGLATVAGNANAGTLTYNTGGFATGLDYRVNPTLLLGGGVGFASGNQWVGGFSGQGSTNSYQASLFASFTPGAFYLDALAGYGYNDNQMTRQIVLPNLGARTAQGRTGANQILGQAEAGYRIGLDDRTAASLTPFARLQATGVYQAGFSESGAQSLSLTVASQTTSSVRSVLGAELAGEIDMGWAEKVTLLLRLGWAHEYADTARPMTAALAGAPGQNFTVYGAAPQRDAVTLGFGVSTAVVAGTELFFRYAGEFSTGSSANSLTGGFRMTW